MSQNFLAKRKQGTYNSLLANIGRILESGRQKAYYAVNNALVNAYWSIGKQIIEFEQKGHLRADYGSKLLNKLSNDLKKLYGVGFSKSNVYLMRQFYAKYSKFQTVSGKLSWSHYAELLMINANLKRNFYEKECIIQSWSIRELQRQINSSLFERIALSKDKKNILKLAKHGQFIEKSEDIVKDPMFLSF